LDGGIRVPQLGAERHDLSLRSQQAGAQLHHHILVVYHLHPEDILLYTIGLDLVLLSMRQEAVDGVLQLILVATAPRSDGLPGGVSHNITDRCSKGWPLVPAKDTGPGEDLCDSFEFIQPSTRDSLDLVSGVEVMPKCSSRAQSLPVGTGASALKASLYNFLPSLSLRGE
jgi:hypothetical protein